MLGWGIGGRHSDSGFCHNNYLFPWYTANFNPNPRRPRKNLILDLLTHTNKMLPISNRTFLSVSRSSNPRSLNTVLRDHISLQNIMLYTWYENTLGSDDRPFLALTYPNFTPEQGRDWKVLTGIAACRVDRSNNGILPNVLFHCEGITRPLKHGRSLS